MKTLTIGEVCVYYPGGEVTLEPAAALVTGVSHGTCVTLAVFQKGSTIIWHRPSVFHLDDPANKNPSVPKLYGTWDTVEAHRERVQEERERLARIRQRAADGEVDRERNFDDLMKFHAEDIVKMRTEQNMTAVDIAQEMSSRTGLSWTYQRIGKMLRNRGLVPT